MMENCLCKYRALRAVNWSSEVLILVVGNDSECKSRFAEDLAEACGATHNHLNRAGVRFFTRECFSEEPAVTVVMDTTPLKTVEDLTRMDNARVWVSQNSLRKLAEQVVFVVCFISCTDPTDEIYQEPNFKNKQFSWLHVLGSVFEKNKKEIMIVVNSEDWPDEAAKQELMRVLQRDGFMGQANISFVSRSERGGYRDTPIIKKVLHSTIDEGGNAHYENGTDNRCAAGMPLFRLPAVVWHDRGMDKFGPWGPENVILFGLSGSGKSTLANMLTAGKLDGVDAKFSTSSGARGETKTVKHGQGRAWRVLDTPGLGESNKDGKCGISTHRAGTLIKEYLMLSQGIFSHYIYVWKKPRVTAEDTRLWEIFNKMFYAEGIENNMTVVVSDADQEWLDKNIDDLKKCFKGCESFITAEFLPRDPDDDKEAEEEKQKIRVQSLEALEEYLASLCRLDSSCKLGMWSRVTQLSMMARGEDSPFTMGSHVRLNLSPTPQPSDFETARALIRFNSLKTKTCLSGTKIGRLTLAVDI